MPPSIRSLLLAMAVGIGFATTVRGEEKSTPAVAGCAAGMDHSFEAELWTKVASRTCLTCHKAGGDAEESKFILLDPKKLRAHAQDDALRNNCEAFTRMAKLKEHEQSRLLLPLVEVSIVDNPTLRQEE